MSPRDAPSPPWTSVVLLMSAWWIVVYGFGALPIPGMQPPWFPSLGTVITNGLGLVAVCGLALLLRRAGLLPRRQTLAQTAGWRRVRLRMLLWALPILLIQAGYLLVGRDGIPEIEGSPALLVGLAIGMLVVGLSEETASRGIPLGAVAASRPWAGVVVTSVLFGLWHAGNGIFFGQGAGDTVWQVVLTAGYGLCFAGARLVMGTIWPLVLLHAFGDWAQLATEGAAPLWYQVLALAVYVAWGIALTALAARRRPPFTRGAE